MTVTIEAKLGANRLQDGSCRFLLWAPFARTIDVHILGNKERLEPLRRLPKGYFENTFGDIEPETGYYYRIDGRYEYPDPASRSQLEGVHGPSMVTDNNFKWSDKSWQGHKLHDYIIYELHTGTFTAEGTFDAIVLRLDALVETGITAIEIMPVAQFPGSRNWGYDGVYPFAVQDSYGGTEGLKRLVNACHAKGIAVVLDVVYNHIGPEGNYYNKFGPYFTERYRTPWGEPINFDGAYSDEVRRYFIENALYWFTDFHIDALRLDALHAIFDFSPRTFLEELAESVKKLGKQLGRRLYLIGESDANDRRLVRSPELGGYGLDAQWNDDFHHVVHVLLTGEKQGYYSDFGSVGQLEKSFCEGFVYSGQYSNYRQRRHGSSSREITAEHFVVFCQNHDQIGNRMEGDRLSHLISFEGLKLAAGVLMLAPFVPLIFMGEEYGETSPFQYFISHSDRALIDAVRNGRKQEFASFKHKGDFPDPQDEATFQRCKINFEAGDEGQHRVLRNLYKTLISMRKTLPALRCLSKDNLETKAFENEKTLFVRRWNEEEEVIVVFNFGQVNCSIKHPVSQGLWQKRLDSADKQWLGNGSDIPSELTSNGEIRMDMAPLSFIILGRV